MHRRPPFVANHVSTCHSDKALRITTEQLKQLTKQHLKCKDDMKAYYRTRFSPAQKAKYKQLQARVPKLKRWYAPRASAWGPS